MNVDQKRLTEEMLREDKEDLKSVSPESLGFKLPPIRIRENHRCMKCRKYRRFMIYYSEHLIMCPKCYKEEFGDSTNPWFDEKGEMSDRLQEWCRLSRGYEGDF